MIKFGPEGWIARISEEFTFENVIKVGRAIAVYLLSREQGDKPFLVSYDTRFQAERFALEIVKVLEAAGINVLLTERDTPTPIVAWETVDKRAAGAVMVTAGSHGAQFSGLKFIKPGGAVCLTDCVREIETYLFLERSGSGGVNLPHDKLLRYQAAASQIGRVARGKVERFEPRERYFGYLSAQVSQARSRPLIVVDPQFGSARGYVDLFLQRLGCRVEERHGHRDVLFGGREPGLTEQHLAELKAKVLERKADCGLAFNSDASAYALIDRSGGFHAGAEAVDPILAALRAIM
ncbi:MAG: hypothetical protein MUC35_04730 [Candidatus Margulisbacteria bacterium]|jgi:phosphomannomutase|nr:hypothetical protein [Candidatus Margulisiibacteriota bacterium]